MRDGVAVVLNSSVVVKRGAERAGARTFRETGFAASSDRLTESSPVHLPKRRCCGNDGDWLLSDADWLGIKPASHRLRPKIRSMICGPVEERSCRRSGNLRDGRCNEGG